MPMRESITDSRADSARISTWSTMCYHQLFSQSSFASASARMPIKDANYKTEVFKLAMQAILLFSVQKVMILTLPFCSAIVYIVQRVYLRTSRQLRFIELESRSAVYSSFLETVCYTTLYRPIDSSHTPTGGRSRYHPSFRLAT